MSVQRGAGDRGVSPVVGVVLLVGIAVTAMGFIGYVAMQGATVEESSHLELVYDESVEGDETTLTVGVRGGYGELDLMVEGEPICDWDGPQTVEEGDAVTIECDNDDVPKGDELQVAQDGAIVEDFEITGPPDELFALSIGSADGAIIEGNTASVPVEIENEGEEDGDQTVELTRGSDTLDSVSVSLDSGESTTETLAWDDTDDVDAPETVSLAVESEDDRVTHQLDVTESGVSNFDVTVEDYDDDVTEGQTVEFEVLVDNTGDEGDTQDIELAVREDEAGGLVASDTYEDLYVGPESSETIELTWETEEGDGGEDQDDERSYPAAVSSEDDSDQTPVVHVAGAPEEATFQAVEAEVTEVGSHPGHGEYPAEVTVRWEATAVPEDPPRFTVDPHDEDATGTGTEGTEVIDLDDHTEEMPVTVTAEIDGETCSRDDIEDEPASVC